VDVDDQGKDSVGCIIGNANKCNKTLILLLYTWILVEALYFANLLSSHGYLFPIDDHFLNVKNDGSYYRFQVSNLWHLTTIDDKYSIVLVSYINI